MHAKLHTTTRRNSLRYYVRVIYSSRFNTRPYIVERYNSRRTGVCFASKRREVEARPRKAVYPTFPMKLDIEQVLSFSFSLYLPRSHFVPYSIRYTNDSSVSIDHLSYYLSFSLSLSLFFFFFYFLSREDSFLGLEPRCNPEYPAFLPRDDFISVKVSKKIKFRSA